MGFNEETQGAREYTLLVRVIVDSGVPVGEILAAMEREAQAYPRTGMTLTTETHELTVTGAWEAGKRKPLRSNDERV